MGRRPSDFQWVVNELKYRRLLLGHLFWACDVREVRSILEHSWVRSFVARPRRASGSALGSSLRPWGVLQNGGAGDRS